MTTTTPEPTTPTTDTTAPRGLVPLPTGAGLALLLIGGIGTIASAFMSWTWTSAFPGDLTVYGYPAGLQILAIAAAVLTLVLTGARLGIPGLRATGLGDPSAVFYAALSAFAVCWFSAIAIAVDLKGIVNLDPGAYVAVVASALTLIGALTLPAGPGGLRAYLTAADRPAPRVPTDPWIRRLVLTLGVALTLITFTYGIGIDDDDSETFIGYLLLLVLALLALNRSGLLARFSAIGSRHKGFAVTLAFIAAVIFPFTQSDDHNANIGVNILTFGTVALGLNIVVGLTGLLDLGYVAFLGVGSYTAALVSGSEYSRFSGVQFPFWAAALTGMAVTLVFGVLIGAPTLRLRGDYLAIVTLGFGEIFRIAVNNMDGSSGPNITNGPNGISQIPDLEILGFNLGDSHDILGFTLGRFSNYFFLMLIVTAIVVTIFTRAADSRIGRSWIAIREDETAATAMGINGFRVKLIAFALGASLAGLAGTVGAHVSYSVNPQPYQFAGAVPPNSAFILAAVVLGGMGTVGGPLLGAALLYLIPEKLGFLQNYELLAFGVALVLLMRFRPEGVIANRRRQLEFHETGQTDVPQQATLTDEPAVTKAGA